MWSQSPYQILNSDVIMCLNSNEIPSQIIPNFLKSLAVLFIPSKLSWHRGDSGRREGSEEAILGGGKGPAGMPTWGGSGGGMCLFGPHCFLRPAPMISQAQI